MAVLVQILVLWWIVSVSSELSTVLLYIFSLYLESGQVSTRSTL